MRESQSRIEFVIAFTVHSNLGDDAEKMTKNEKIDKALNDIETIKKEITKLKKKNDIDESEKQKQLAYDFTLSIIDKQYRSYLWNDSKIQSLITINAAIIAGILVVTQIYSSKALLYKVPLIISLGCQLISLIIALIHVVPKINSKIGNEFNLRTMVGISPYIQTKDKDEYVAKILGSNVDDFIKMNCYQIVGMCKNNLRSEKFIRAGVILALIGICFFVIGLMIVVVL